MPAVLLAHEVDWGGWRDAARRLVLAGVRPDDVVWSVRPPGDLPAEEAGAPPAAPPAGTFNVKRSLVELAQIVIQAREPTRFALLYELLWRAHGGETLVLDQATDPALQRAQRLAQAVRRDTHRMRACIRFRVVEEPEGIHHVAWFEPEHYIVEANASFFARHFATMRWSILTPDRGVHWDGTDLHFTAGASPADVPDDAALAAYWRAHCSAIFNPARFQGGAMIPEMPRKDWRHLPEAAAMPDMIRNAAGGPSLPAQELPTGGLAQAAREAVQCRACPLWGHATQTVFGEGPADARLMFVGEQPGDQEDLGGRPFIGPAGQMLDRALAEIGFDRASAYVTNAVKHFKFEPRGKRRIHVKPDNEEIAACKFWLDLERQDIRPAVIVLLGASAARAVLGRNVTISRERSRPIALDGNAQALVTVHPSYLLRLPDEASQQREYAVFVEDLRRAAALAAR